MEADDTHDSDEQPDVCLGELVADEVVLAGEHLLQPVERREQRLHSRLVRLLRRRKPGFVHAVCREHERRDQQHTQRGGTEFFALLTVSYTHSLTSSISLRCAAG